MQKRSCEERACMAARRVTKAAALMAVLAAMLPVCGMAQVSTTTVQGTVYRADGTPAGGTLLISWPAFTTAQDQAVAAGNLNASIGANGFVSVNLTPNAGGLPSGTYYTATYHLNDGSVDKEYWVVPASGTATIGAVRAELQPSTVAVQSTVTPSYVQSAIASLSGTFLPLSGGTLSGSLTLDSDPVASSQAATKHYADQLAAQNLPLSGGTLSGPLTAPSFFTKQMEGRLYADQWQSGASSNNGIAMSLSQCASLPYACQVLAPALYANTEQPSWEQVNFTEGAEAPQWGSTSTATLVDQRWGGDWETTLNPYTQYIGASSNNVFAGRVHKTFWGERGQGALNQNYMGDIFSCVHTAGGVLSQIYDNANQSGLNCFDILSHRYTTEAGAALNVNSYATAPGDAPGLSVSVFGPAGDTHQFDEGMELGLGIVSETINVYRGQVATTGGSKCGTLAAGQTCLTITPAAPLGGSGEAIAGTQGEGRYLINTAPASSFTPSAVTGYAGQIISGSSYSYFSSVTSTGLPTSTATGYLTSAVTTPYGSETVNFTVNSGTLTTGVACIADQGNTGQFGQHALGNFETVDISSVSGSEATATFTKSHPIGATYWQGGGCGTFLELTADTLPSGSSWTNGEFGGTTSYAVRWVYPVLGSLDGTHLIVFTAANNGKQNAVNFGSAWTSSSSKGVNLYKGAETYRVTGVNDDTSDNVFTLAPNNAGFVSGQAVELDHMYNQETSGGNWNMSQWSPSGLVTGPSYGLNGRVEYPSTGVTVINHNSWSNYTNGGGAWTLPLAAFNAVGSWDYGFFYQTYGFGNVLNLLGTFAPAANTSIGLIGFNASGSADQFTYKTPSSGVPNGGTWGLHGNLSVTGSVRSTGTLMAASINGEITVDGTTYTSLNAAWTAAAAQASSSGQNQTVRLAPGTYAVTATLTEPMNGACVNLLGSGGTTMNADSSQIATTLTVPSTLSGDVISLGNTTQAQGCTFKDFDLLAGGNATHGFELQWFRGLLIDNVTVNDTTAEGILLGEEDTSAGHQASFLLRNVTVSYSSAAFTPANRPAYGIHLQKTAIDSHLDDVVVRNALTAAVYNEGTGNTGYLIHGFGYPYTCTTGPCANNASSGSAANASYATSYVIYDVGGGGSVWTDTYVDSPATAGFYIGANGVAIHGGHIQWPDVTSFPSANLAYVAANVSNNLLIADVDCLEMAAGVNWITYAGASGNPPSYASVHHLTGCGNYYQALEPANTSGFSSGGANINDPSGAVPRVWSTPIAAAASYPAFSAQMYTGYQGDAFQAHFSGVNPFFNVTYQGTIRTNGGIALSTVTNTASTLTLTPANKNVIADASSGPQTITLPSCYTPLPDRMAPTGLEFTIIKSDTSANAVTLATTSSQTIYSQGVGASTLVLSGPSTETLVCGPDSNWYVAGSTASGGGSGSAPHMTWYGSFAGTFGTSTNNSLGAIWSPTDGVNMTRLDIAVGTAPSGCATWPAIGIYDSTAGAWLKTVTLASGTYSYRNAVSAVAVPAGHNLSMGVQTAGAGCSTNAGSAQLTMEYTMQ